MNDGKPASRPPDPSARSAAATFAAFFQRDQSTAEPPRQRSRVWPIAAAIGVVLIVVSLVGGRLLSKKTQAASTSAASAKAPANAR